MARFVSMLIRVYDVVEGEDGKETYNGESGSAMALTEFSDGTLGTMHVALPYAMQAAIADYEERNAGRWENGPEGGSNLVA